MPTAAERLAHRANVVALAALAALTLLAWLYLWSGAGFGPMADMPGMAGAMPASDWPLTVLMWAAMMVAMMLPSAGPAILLYGTVSRHSEKARTPPTAAFLGGYFACWTLFAVLAATLQYALERASFASPMSMTLVSINAAGAVLILAGLYQLTPLKDACLGKCRSPAQFLWRHFRPGSWGAFRLGLLHGAYCVGCCWLLMALLFVGGVMNLAWIALLTLLVAAEKLLPGGPWIARVAGIAMIGWGAYLILA